jgi:uncharacterized protein (TIRG00374 family)
MADRGDPARRRLPHLPDLPHAPPPEELEAALAREVEPPRPSALARWLRWGLAAFALVSVAGFAAAFALHENWAASVEALVRIQPAWILPALAVPFLDWLGGGLRLRVLLGPFGDRPSLLRCTEIAAATAGSAWLTPSGAGGGPAQLYGLTRAGVPLGRAGAVNAAAFLSNLTFLALAALVAWGAGAGRALEHMTLPVGELSAGRLFAWTAWAMAGAAAAILTLALVSHLARAPLRRALRQHRHAERWLRHLEELRLGILTYAGRGKLAFLASLPATAVHFGSRILLGWILLRGFGVPAPFGHVVVLHTMIHVLLFFMPTPGGAGLGELLAPMFMAPYLPAGLLLPYTALWRLFLSYISVAVGAALLLGWLGKGGSNARGLASATGRPS